MSDVGYSTDDLFTWALELAEMTEPPGDSAIYVPGTSIRRVMMGIDIGAAELLLARDISVDAVIAHHPAGGQATLNFHQVLRRQITLLLEAGVNADRARAVVEPKIAAATLRAQTANSDHAPSVARLLNLPFLNVHLPLDELGRRMMVEAIALHRANLPNPEAATVGDMVTALKSIPEIADAPTKVMVPVGRLDALAGRVVVFHGAGTNGGAAVAEALFDAGVGTVIYIHIAPEEAVRLKEHVSGAGSLIISGHIASDMIGINPYVKLMEERGLEIIRMSGL